MSVFGWRVRTRSVKRLARSGVIMRGVSNQMRATGPVPGEQLAHLRLGLLAQVLVVRLPLLPLGPTSGPKSQSLPAPPGSCQSWACE